MHPEPYLDQVTFAFAMCWSIFAVANIRIVLREKSVKGVTPYTMVFVVAWKLWSVFLLWKLDQTLAASGYAFLALFDLTYLTLLFRYRDAAHA